MEDEVKRRDIAIAIAIRESEAEARERIRKKFWDRIIL